MVIFLFFLLSSFHKALRAFHDALELMEGNEPKKTTLKSCFVNMGHCYRKLKQFDLAIANYEKALSLDPYCASSLSALGFVHQLLGKSLEAIEFYHQALSLRPGDGFTSEMLSRALQEHFHKPLSQANIAHEEVSSKVTGFIQSTSQYSHDTSFLEEEEGGQHSGNEDADGDDNNDDDDDMMLEE